MDQVPERNAWGVVKRARSFKHAVRGVRIFFGTTPNASIHLCAIVIVVFLGFYLEVSPLEWLSLVLVMGLVLVAEAFNTAIEIDINLTSPDYHPYARDTKDVAAGAVLITAMIAVIVGFIVFLPKVI